MFSRQINDTDSLTFAPRTTADQYECYLCGEKFVSEMSKDVHMENCMVADGPSSLDSSLDAPVRALLRSSSNHGALAYTSPPHLPRNQTHQKSDFSSAVGSRIETNPLTAQPLIPQGYSQSEPLEEDMRRRIQYPPKPKYPASPPVLNGTQIAPYMQEGAKIQLFQNMNIQTTQFQPRTPQYPFAAPLPQSTAPFGYSRSSQMMYTPRAPPPAPGVVLVSSQPPHPAVTRHSSDPRTREFEVKSVISPLTQHTAVTRSNWRESSQHDGDLNRPVARHNHPVSDPPPPPKLISAGGPAGEGARGKFEVKLVWEKQQPTLETTLEYLDNVDTDQTLLKWEARKEAFSGTVRLSPGEHTGSLAIPDTELVVYEVHPFNVSQYSVSVQEIKLDLVDIAPRYNAPPEPLKRPLYSQIDVHSKHVTTNPRHELQSQNYLSEKKEDSHSAAKYQHTQTPQVAPPFQIVREERRATLPDSAVLRTNLPAQEFHSLPQEQPVPVPVSRPTLPAKYREESKLERDTSQLRTPPFQIVREERRISLSGPQRDQSAPRSTQPGLEERSRVEVMIPPHDQPLPPPRNKPAATSDKSREELEYKKQIDSIIEKLKGELTNSRAERENVEKTLGAEARKWHNNYDNLYKLKDTVDKENDILKRELDQLKKQFVSALTKLHERSTGGDRLEERQAVLLREKEEAVKERDEARTKQQLTEKRSKDLESRIQNLLDESQKKIQNIQMERDSYKAAAYKYKTERDRIRLCHEEERTSHEELKTVHQQLKDEYEQKISDNSHQINILVNKLRQAETVKLDNYTLNNNNKDGTLVVGSSTERDARTGYNEWGSMSLGGIQFDQRTGLDKRERYTPKEKSQEKKPVPAKKPSLTSGHEVTSKLNSEYAKPSSSSVSREPVAPTEAPPHVVKSYKRKPSVQNRVQEFEGRSADTPKATPRLGRAQSSQKAEGLETYRPDLLTSFIHKHTPVVYKTSSITATKLSYFHRPESHLLKQVLVKVRDIYRPGTLQVVFSKKYSFPNKTIIIAGVKLEETVGNSDGCYEGMRYFECEHNHALFASLEEVLINVS